MTPTATAPVSVLTVNGRTVPPGQASDTIALDVGLNTISVLVTAQNGATRTYSINITRIAKVVAVSAGLQHAVALKEGGTLVAWGENSKGESSIPPGLAEVGAVSAGYHHAVALKDDGTVIAWGDNTYGQTVLPPAANP